MQKSSRYWERVVGYTLLYSVVVYFLANIVFGLLLGGGGLAGAFGLVYLLIGFSLMIPFIVTLLTERSVKHLTPAHFSVRKNFFSIFCIAFVWELLFLTFIWFQFYSFDRKVEEIQRERTRVIRPYTEGGSVFINE